MLARARARGPPSGRRPSIRRLKSGHSSIGSRHASCAQYSKIAPVARAAARPSSRGEGADARPKREPVRAVDGRDRVELHGAQAPDRGLDVVGVAPGGSAARSPACATTSRRTLREPAPSAWQRGAASARVGEVLEQVGARDDADRLPSSATTTAFVPPVSAVTISSTDASASTVASGGCIAVATSSCSASAFLKTRSSRSRSCSEPITSASDATSPSRTTGQLRDRVALHHVDRLADLLVRRDRDERRQSSPRALRAQQLARPSAPVRGARGSRARASTCRRGTSRGTSGPSRAASSGRCASGPSRARDLSAPATVVPDEPPASSPSSRASRRAVRNESRSETRTHSSTTVGSIVSGQVSLPIPSTKYGCRSPSLFAV